MSEYRLRQGKNAHATLGISDAQSVKNTDTASEKGYDGGKNISGIKRHIMVDIHGFPIALSVTTANVTDRDGSLQAIHDYQENLVLLENTLVDGGYTGEKYATSVFDAIGCCVEVAKRNELHKFAVIPVRWIVERSFGWLEKHRRLWKNCERQINTSLQIMVFAFISIILKRL